MRNQASFRKVQGVVPVCEKISGRSPYDVGLAQAVCVTEKPGAWNKTGGDEVYR